ncbi:uncharacterized protein [Montipora foliosa]
MVLDHGLIIIRCIRNLTATLRAFLVEGLKQERSTVHPEILARGPLASEAYEKALTQGKTRVKTVPIMLIGQDGAGKTSLKKSLKGMRFDPEEDSTVGIDVDPCNFRVTTETWRTGKAGDEQDADAALSFDYHAARCIVDKLKEGNKRPLTEPSESPSDNDETKVPIAHFISETEGDAKSDETHIEPAAFFMEDAFSKPSSPVEHNPKTLSDSSRYIPEEIAMETETLLKGNWEDHRENIYSTLWDFAGQSVYYVTHPLFLTERAIYCLVYDLSFNPNELAMPLVKQGVYKKHQDTFNLKTNLDHLDFWMRSVASVSRCAYDHEKAAKIAAEGVLPQKLPSVFLVCTHADTPYDKNRNPREIAYEILGCLKSKPYGIHLFSDVFVVDNRKSGTTFECSEVIRLRRQILAVAEELPYISEAIPIKWLKFKKALTTLKEEGQKCISLKDAKDIASNTCNVTEEREIKTLLDYLHDLRSIIHFDDSPELNKLVILDPQWLIDVFKKVITVQPAYQLTEKKLLDKWIKLETHGLLDEELLKHVWKSLSNDEETYKSLIAVMEKFSLMCLWPLDASGNKSYLVPSLLKSFPPKKITELVASSELPSLFLTFEDGLVPAGLFPRLVLAIFQWGEEEFWKSAMKLHLFCNFARFFTSTENDCSVILVCHSSFIEIVVHNANISHDSVEDLVSNMSYCSDFQRDNTSSNGTFTRTFCSQVALILECMRHEFFWLKNMRYEMSISCPVCCNRGAVNFCPVHCKQGCKEEECLHFWPISELRTANAATFCTRSASAINTRVAVSQFTHWFPPLDHKVSKSGIDDSYKNFVSSVEGNEDKVLALPDKLQESLASLSCDPQQIVSLFKEKKPPVEASLENPDHQTMKWIRCLSREANKAKRLDVVQHLRSISHEGTVGPLLPENLDVREIPFGQGRQLTIALSGGDEWKLVAEKLGLNPREISYLDKRVVNPAEALLAYVAEKRGLTVGELYDVLSNCSLPLLADEL